MNLTAKEIYALSHGAVRYEEIDGVLYLRRFTARAKKEYDTWSADFARKSCATAGVRLAFSTDADHFDLSVRATPASSRRFCYFDIYVDDVMIAHIGKEPTECYEETLALDLPCGTHRVEIYFPNLFEGGIKSLSFPDGATVEPVKKACRILEIGDSITHGYDAYLPSCSYANQLADKLGASPVNLGIGAEFFNPDMVDPDMDFAPDIITVAFGTNDWNGKTRDYFAEHAEEMFRKLRAAYPAAKIFAITPIWRGDCHRVTAAGTFEEARAIVRTAAKKQAGVVVIEGDSLVPHIPAAFSPDILHPNDLGFCFYADRLYAAMKPHLEERNG